MSVAPILPIKPAGDLAESARAAGEATARRAVSVDVEVPLAALESLLCQSAPLVLNFPSGLILDLRDPYAIQLVENEGLRASCTGSLKMDAMGLTANATIRQAIVMMRARLSPAPEWRLTVDVRVEEADLVLVPGFLERSIVDKVNTMLGGEEVTLAFDLGSYAHQTIPISSVVETIEAFKLFTSAATLTIGTQSVVAHLEVDSGFLRADRG